MVTRLVCYECRRRGQGDGAVTRGVEGSFEVQKCAICRHVVSRTKLPGRRRRRSRNTSATTVHGPVRRAPVSKQWEPVAPPPTPEGVGSATEDEGELQLTAPEAVERGRVERIRTGILASLSEHGRLTRDRLGELLLPELSPQIARRHISPRVDELIAEGVVRETAYKALTRLGNQAALVELVG